MKIAITGGTGFVGGHLAADLGAKGHELLLLSRNATFAQATRSRLPNTKYVSSDMSDVSQLREQFEGCSAVAHCAGINREIGSQTYTRVHIDATRNVVEAAKSAGVRKIVFMSFLRARPDCGSAYHESKWQAEEIVRTSGLEYTIVRSGMIYGRGDHMLDHLSHAFYTLPILATVGFQPKPVRPLAIDDLIRVLRAALVENRLTDQSVAITGPEELSLGHAVQRVAKEVGRRVWMFPAPLLFHYALAIVCEATMKVPLVAKAQVRILSEGVVDAALPCNSLPSDLLPVLRFTAEQIRGGLPEPGPFGLHDLRC